MDQRAVLCMQVPLKATYNLPGNVPSWNAVVPVMRTDGGSLESSLKHAHVFLQQLHGTATQFLAPHSILELEG